MQTLDIRHQLIRQFWAVHVPMMGLGAIVLWLECWLMLGSTRAAWTGAVAPVLIGSAYIYPWRLSSSKRSPLKALNEAR